MAFFKVHTAAGKRWCKRISFRPRKRPCWKKQSLERERRRCTKIKAAA